MEQETKHAMTCAAALEWIAQAPEKAKFAVHTRVDVCNADGEVMADYRRMAALQVSREEATQLIKNYLTRTLENDGFRIPCTTVVSDDMYACYWIG